jgi:hypothetical protein
MLWAIAGLLGVVGCASDSGCEADALEDGAVLADLDGEAWEGGGASFLWGADGVQVNTVRTNGWMLTLKLESTIDGATLREAMEGDALPVEVALSEDGLSGWLMAYPESGGSYTSKNEMGGSITITSLSEAALSVCFDAVVQAGDGEQIDISSGQMRAPSME